MLRPQEHVNELTLYQCKLLPMEVNNVFSMAMCGSRKYPFLPHGWSLKLPRGRGSQQKFLGVQNRTFHIEHKQCFKNCCLLHGYLVQVLSDSMCIRKTYSSISAPILTLLSPSTLLFNSAT